MSINNSSFSGNLGRDAELRVTPSGTKQVTFSMATTAWVGKEVTTWLKVVWFGPTAEKLKDRLVKGARVYVQGKVYIDEWTNREGNTVQTLTLQANDVQLLDRNAPQPISVDVIEVADDEDVPF